ncbi:hypothetical protein [Sediminibacterium sp. TEGAF015]|jgi:hypothetical protein|uniref:hypothetical protein n=1 Tax=Sediminibacterium sp. TEGAF015 TaxID=575378 RepID=UPI0021FB62E5|nr:hypothetical protein [Sediminibacterium sp. TEGAF015]BDQ11641.1 hypothetical protein TEGAF0_08580 [Sediminibacterium sp. TEGAF015]
MHETFDLPVWYNGKEIMFPAELQPYGYTHRITVHIENFPFMFEPDEEKNYRVILMDQDRKKAGKIDPYLLHVIAETLKYLFT